MGNLKKRIGGKKVLSINTNTPKKSKHNDLAIKWIKENLIPIKSDYNLISSYKLKHKFEYATDIYMFNGEFKYAMNEAGFNPAYKTESNWYYRISKKSPGLEWVSHGWKRDKNYREYKVEGWKPVEINELV